MEYRHKCPRLYYMDGNGMGWTRSILSVFTVNRLWDHLQSISYGKGINKQNRARLQLLEAQNIQVILCNRLMVSYNKLSLSIRFKISDK